MASSEKEQLLSLKKALAKIWSVDDKNDWPVKFSSVSHLFLGEFYNVMHKAFYELLEKGYTLNDISALLGKPSKIFRSFDLVLRGMVINNIPVIVRRRFIYDLLCCVECQKSGSIFNEDGKNIIYDETKVSWLVNRTGWQETDLQGSIALHRLIGMIKAYIEVLYFRSYDMSQEIHGPYHNTSGSIIIREFSNLSPKTLWEEFEFINCNEIVIIAEYDDSVKINIDSYNHMYQLGESFVPHLLRFSAVADGKCINEISEINALIDRISHAILKNRDVIKNYNWKRLTRKYAEICWYKIRKLLEESNMPAGIPESVDINISNGSIEDRDESVFRSEKIKLLLNILF